MDKKFRYPWQKTHRETLFSDDADARKIEAAFLPRIALFFKDYSPERLQTMANSGELDSLFPEMNPENIDDSNVSISEMKPFDYATWKANQFRGFPSKEDISTSLPVNLIQAIRQDERKYSDTVSSEFRFVGVGYHGLNERFKSAMKNITDSYSRQNSLSMEVEAPVNNYKNHESFGVGQVVYQDQHRKNRLANNLQQAPA